MRDDLADLALEVQRRAQRPFEAGARHLERVVAGHRVVVVEVTGDHPGDEGQRVEGDAAGGPGRRVDRDPQRAAAQLDVVEVELEVGDEGRDETGDAVDGACCRTSAAPLVVRCLISAPFRRKGVDPAGPRLQFIELRDPGV